MDSMYILVLDANVPWDLDIKINKLNEIMHLMDNINFKIYMSNINFHEMPYSVQINLKNHNHVIIDNEPDQKEYSEFKNEIQRRGVILDKKDSAVLFTSNKFDADYIVSSDAQVQKMAKKYADIFGKKVKPFHLINMFSFLRGINLIEPHSCIKMSLELYKHKEIPYMIEEYGKQLIADKIRRNEWIKTEIKSSVDIFNSYEQHIIGHLR